MKYCADTWFFIQLSKEDKKVLTDDEHFEILQKHKLLKKYSW